MIKTNIVTLTTGLSLGLVSFILIETNSQTIKEKVVEKKETKVEIPKLVIRPLKPKVDTILHKIDTINQEQLETKIILIGNAKRSDNALGKLKDLEEFTEKENKDSVVFDTVVIYKEKKDSVIVEKVLIDTIVIEKTFFQKIFKFLPFKKRRE